MNSLYPDPKTRSVRQLDRGLHRIHVELSGKPDGYPLLLIHGGPGTGLDPLHRRLADAERFQLIQFDQRGCGRSEPLGEVRENSLAELLDDIEAIRDMLGVEEWLVFGHGWGATLGLAYAQAHRSRVSGLVLSSLFLGRPLDVDWSFAAGAARFFPDAWELLTEKLPAPVTTSQLLDTYDRLLSDANELKQIQAARRWARWETTIQVVHPSQSLAERLQHPHVAVSLARLSCHYLRANCFLEDSPLLEGMEALSGLPGILVHGRFNVVSPLDGACRVHQAWPDSELFIIREGSHSLYDHSMADAVMRALSQLGARILGDDGPSAQ